MGAENLERQVNEAFTTPEPDEGKKFWALMLFFTELELGVSNSPNKWVNVSNRFYKDGVSALNAYANTPCPASQLVDAKTKEELLQGMKDMVQNFKDEKWLEENLYPYL